MKTKQFLNGNNLRKLNKKMNEFLNEGDSYKGTYRNLLIRQKTFKQIDVAEGKRNNVSSVVQVEDSILQCSRAFWLTGTKWTPTLYVQASAYTEHGFGSKKKVLLIYKDSKGRKDSIELFRSWDREDFLKDFPSRLLEVDKTQKLVGKPWNIRNRYKKMIENKIRGELYDNMTLLERGLINEDFKNLLAQFGCFLVESVPFTDKFQMYGLKGVQVQKNKIKMALKNVSTYCSLPSILEIVFKKSELGTVRLDKYGIETAGYYDHSERLEIRSEFLEQAKKLNREFNSIKES